MSRARIDAWLLISVFPGWVPTRSHSADRSITGGEVGYKAGEGVQSSWVCQRGIPVEDIAQIVNLKQAPTGKT